jgi:hypothetical protein
MTQSLLTRPLVHEDPRPSLDKYLPKQLDRPTERELDQVLAERQSFSQRSHPAGNWSWTPRAVKAMFHCPRRYYYELILGLRTPQQSRDLIFGLAYQEALVEYELCRAGGGSHEHSIQSALQVGLIRGKDLPVDPKADGEGTTPIKKRKDMLALAIVTYCDQFGINDPIQTLRLTNGKPAVELSFRLAQALDFPTERKLNSPVISIVPLQVARVLRCISSITKALETDQFRLRPAIYP